MVEGVVVEEVVVEEVVLEEVVVEGVAVEVLMEHSCYSREVIHRLHSERRLVVWTETTGITHPNPRQTKLRENVYVTRFSKERVKSWMMLSWHL